jgi:hypothetical protein
VKGKDGGIQKYDFKNLYYFTVDGRAISTYIITEVKRTKKIESGDNVVM